MRQGYVSHVRYTHYSLLRTIEAALGLGTLTANDRYAEPVNDVFLPGQAAPAPSAPGQLPRPLLLLLLLLLLLALARPAALLRRRQPPPPAA